MKTTVNRLDEFLKTKAAKQALIDWMEIQNSIAGAFDKFPAGGNVTTRTNPSSYYPAGSVPLSKICIEANGKNESEEWVKASIESEDFAKQWVQNRTNYLVDVFAEKMLSALDVIE